MTERTGKLKAQIQNVILQNAGQTLDVATAATQILQACKEEGLVWRDSPLGASHPHLDAYFTVKEIEL